jgi:hypothetical protein
MSNKPLNVLLVTEFLTCVKPKVKLALCLIKRHSVEKYEGAEVVLHALLTSALDGGEWFSSCCGRFSPIFH